MTLQDTMDELMQQSPSTVGGELVPLPNLPPAPSPFLPGTNIQYAWDSTSLGEFKTCPRRYQYKIIEGWITKAESVHLRFGSEYHTSLQHYDVSISNGVRHEDAIHDVIRDLVLRTDDYNPDPETKAGKYKSRSNLVGLVIAYLDKFGPNDPAQTVMLENGKPAVELSFKLPLNYGPHAGKARTITVWEGQKEIVEKVGNDESYLLCGHLDRVVEFNNDLMVMDRKTTTATLSQYYFQQYEPDNQMTLYTLAAKTLIDSPVRGVIIDAAQILLEKPHYFDRGFTYRTPDQLEEWLDDLRIYLLQAETYATLNYWPQNDKSCNMYGGCPFREICNKSPHVRDKFLATNFIQLEPSLRWNPLRER